MHVLCGGLPLGLLPSSMLAQDRLGRRRRLALDHYLVDLAIRGLHLGMRPEVAVDLGVPSRLPCYALLCWVSPAQECNLRRVDFAKELLSLNSGSSARFGRAEIKRRPCSDHICILIGGQTFCLGAALTVRGSMEAAVQRAVAELSSLVARLSSPEPFHPREQQLKQLLEELKKWGPEAVEAFCRAAAGPAAALASFSPPPPVEADSARLQLQHASIGCIAAANLLDLLCDQALCSRLGHILTYRLAASSR